MGTLAGAVGGFAGLCLLDVATASQQSGARAGGILGGVAKAVAWWLDPTVPAIPDRHGTASPAPGPAKQPGSGGEGVGNVSGEAPPPSSTPPVVRPPGAGPSA